MHKTLKLLDKSYSCSILSCCSPIFRIDFLSLKCIFSPNPAILLYTVIQKSLNFIIITDFAEAFYYSVLTLLMNEICVTLFSYQLTNLKENFWTVQPPPPTPPPPFPPISIIQIELDTRHSICYIGESHCAPPFGLCIRRIVLYAILILSYVQSKH